MTLLIIIILFEIIVIVLAIIAVAANCYSNVVKRRVKRDLEKLQEDVRQYFGDNLNIDDAVEEAKVVDAKLRNAKPGQVIFMSNEEIVGKAKEQDHINNIQ